MKDKYNFPLINYHSHTTRCQHAFGTEEEYVQAAIETGLSLLGFADHTPWPYTNGYVSDIRMTLEQFPDYERIVRGLQEKYADKIRIRLGLECEAFPAYFDWLKDFKAEHLDYVIMGNHFDTDDSTGGLYFGKCKTAGDLRRYVECGIRGFETGLYDYMAHPDLFMKSYHAFDENAAAASHDLCAAAKSMNIPLEFNLLGQLVRHKDLQDGGQGYPHNNFWEVAAEHGCTAIIGFDAHRLPQLQDAAPYWKAYEFLTGLGLNVISAIGR